MRDSQGIQGGCRFGWAAGGRAPPGRAYRCRRGPYERPARCVRTAYGPAMAKARTSYVCRECGAQHPRWMGKCPDCGTWESLEEVQAPAKAAAGAGGGSAGRDAAVAFGGKATSTPAGAGAARPLREINAADQDTPRAVTGIGELDRVLGGGLVPGSVVLLGGDPGIGKSTLMLQAGLELARVADRSEGKAGGVLYVTAEESAAQVRMRAERLGGEAGMPGSFYVLSDIRLEAVLDAVTSIKPAAVVIDSVQMMAKADVPAAAGTVTQLRACTLELVALAKAGGPSVCLVGHVTKDGALAGPKLLEHMVDTVLHFEGDRFHAHRVVRAVKNRFGNTLEVGLFEMTGAGLVEVDPSRLTVGVPGGVGSRPGSAVCPVLHGTRCLLVEIQALTAAGFVGSTKRKASGLDTGRLAMLIAILEKHGGLRLADQDIFVSAVGGVRVAEPAADLALALAIAGVFLNRGLSDPGGGAGGVAAVGELGLGGELRRVQQLERRVAEARRLGFATVLVPADSVPKRAPAGVRGVRGIEEALQLLG